MSKTAANGDRRRQSTNAPNAVKVSVSDTGPGIRPEFHLEIFDDFFRLPGSESAEGMGLGLAIARRLLQGMGGKIWVESEPGAGSKFSFLIPLKPILSSPPRGNENESKPPTSCWWMTNRECCATSAPCWKWTSTRSKLRRTGEEALAQRPERAAARPGSARSAHARHRRFADARATSPDQARTESRHALLRERHAQSRAGDAAGRDRLPDQALPESRTRRGHRSVRRRRPRARATPAKSKSFATTCFSSPPARR